jgi:hypothetical protein
MFNTDGAACIGMDPELFFLTNNIPRHIEKTLEKTCMRCPVFDACLDYALKVKVNGYWAGTTDKTRVEMRMFFNITPIRIDEEYHFKDMVGSQTPDAKYKRKLRDQKEAG